MAMHHGDKCRAYSLTPFAWRVLPLIDLDMQLAAERRRQRGWRTVCASSGEPPEALKPGGELVHGPPGAHVEKEGLEMWPDPNAFHNLPHMNGPCSNCESGGHPDFCPRGEL